jgi:hypothetical protein
VSAMARGVWRPAALLAAHMRRVGLRAAGVRAPMCVLLRVCVLRVCALRDVRPRGFALATWTEPRTSRLAAALAARGLTQGEGGAR